MPYSTANSIKIYYEVSGEGFPFVMVHANPFDHNLWMYQIAHFSTYFKVIAVDIRGYGRSDKPTTPFSLKDMAGDVLGVCRDEDIKEAILGGVSVGSGMALLLGLDHPEMFKALILVGGNSGGAGSIDDRIHGYTKIGGQEFLLPLKNTLRMRHEKYLSKNESDYRLYNKFSADATVRICALDALSAIVVDDGISVEWRRRLRATGARVVVVPTAAAARRRASA